jgi:hypothetical protein
MTSRMNGVCHLVSHLLPLLGGLAHLTGILSLFFQIVIRCPFSILYCPACHRESSETRAQLETLAVPWRPTRRS